MKKVLIILVICVLAVVGVSVVINNQTIRDGLSKFISGFYNENLEEYSNDFEINRLRIKNQDFYYNTLNNECKNVYTAIANATKDLKESVKVNEYEYIDNQKALEDVEIAMNAFFADHPEVFYVNNQYTIVTSKILFKDVISVNLTYSVASKSELEEKIVAIEKSIDNIMNGVVSNNPIEMQIYLHDNVAKNTEYYDYTKIEDVPQDCHNIYGAFINNKAVCDGFTKAMQILLNKKDIESISVLGKLETQSHAWNLVKLNDNWYHMDLTSNKSIKETKNNEPIILHSYFNITTEEISKTHTIENAEFIPKCTSDEYNYYKYKDKHITSEDDFNNKLVKLLKNNEDPNLLEFKVTGISGVPEKIVNTLSKNRYNEYISSNRITYYNILDTYSIIKK